MERAVNYEKSKKSNGGTAYGGAYYWKCWRIGQHKHISGRNFRKFGGNM
jgi:hypothetical protein